MNSEPGASAHPAGLDDDHLLRQCTVRRVRRSGPGGQHRNKVETGIELLHSPTGTAAEATERRSQAQNRAVALRRLRLALALGLRNALPDSAAPSPLWTSRCSGGRIRVNPDHADLPLLLAEALDFLAAEKWNVQAAAARLECSTTQLTRLLALEPRALAQLNKARTDAGLRPLL